MEFVSILACLSTILSTISAHWDPAYFRHSDDGFEKYEQWMKHIDDRVLISELAIPGTHDSATFNATPGIPIYSDMVTTQTLNFSDQLNYGTRAFDIRIRHINDGFALYHGIAYLPVTFESFLQAVRDFLTAYPSEVVLVRLKEEYAADTSNSRSLADTLQYYLQLYNEIYLNVTDNLSLGDARGKLILLDDLDLGGFGLNYTIFDIQDRFMLKSKWDLHRKWEQVKQQLLNARHGDRKQFYVNYLSGAVGSYPYFVASGHTSSGTSAPNLSTGYSTIDHSDYYPEFPRECSSKGCNIVFEGVNTLTRDAIQKFNIGKMGAPRTIGIVMADFPGTELIKCIIRNNFAVFSDDHMNTKIFAKLEEF